MLTGTTKSDTVELAEDAETISLMLAFIYPVALPSITTAERLERVMLSAQKYDIERMIEFVKGFNRPDDQLVLSDPVGVFRASTGHHFPTIQARSAKTFGLNHCNFHDPEGVKQLAAHIPESSSVIGLLGAQIIRGKLLSNLLKGGPVSPGLLPKADRADHNHTHYMACRQCWDRTRKLYTNEPSSRYIPGWIYIWLSSLHSRLLEKPLDSCTDLLSISCIVSLYGGTSAGCSNCVEQTLNKCSLFEQWALETKGIVDEELEVLDKLYTL